MFGRNNGEGLGGHFVTMKWPQFSMDKRERENLTFLSRIVTQDTNSCMVVQDWASILKLQPQGLEAFFGQNEIASREGISMSIREDLIVNILDGFDFPSAVYTVVLRVVL